MKLSNNTILITGGTSGIGYELGKELLKRNNQVILLGRNQEKLYELQKFGFEVIKCDLSNQNEIENAVLTIQSQYPDLNILFNNAGIQYNYHYPENSNFVNEVQQEMTVNFTGQVILTQKLLPILNTAPKSLIINTTSGLRAFPKMNALIYCASKSALHNFTVGLRYLLKNSQINVLEFIPPVTETNMTAGRKEQKMDTQTLIKLILPQIEQERKIVTTFKLRLFLNIAFLFPNLAHKILSKN